MKNHRIRYLLLAGGYCASLSAACQMVSGKTIEYSVNVSRASINLDVSDLPIGSLLYSYGGMIITNNERWRSPAAAASPAGFRALAVPGSARRETASRGYLQHRPPAGHRLQLSDGGTGWH
ncbi:hypothetical protein J4733_07425 [Klebsiella pneumoniae]|uniref:Fimbrial protein n=1 Tax=Klebsiella pneumoniae TaxID=573 RepID=A0A939NRA9_KLEPN|nr:hypothetical protein [Klebsiella pneumoniae]